MGATVSSDLIETILRKVLNGEPLTEAEKDAVLIQCRANTDGVERFEAIERRADRFVAVGRWVAVLLFVNYSANILDWITRA